MQKFLAALITTAALAILVACLAWLRSTRHPNLSLTYIPPTNPYSRFKFGVTNVGKCTVFTSTFGKIEFLDYTNVFWVQATSPLRKLAPGQGQVVEAILSDGQKDTVDWGGKWRLTCLYAGDGMRTRIYDWQWAPGGPGTNVNWLGRLSLSRKALSVKATSDWIPSIRKP